MSSDGAQLARKLDASMRVAGRFPTEAFRASKLMRKGELWESRIDLDYVVVQVIEDFVQDTMSLSAR